LVMIRYRVPFAPDRPGSRYKARVQFVRSIIGEGARGTLYTTPRGSLAIEFDAPTAADARRGLARPSPPPDPRPVRGASLLIYAAQTQHSCYEGQSSESQAVKLGR